MGRSRCTGTGRSDGEGELHGSLAPSPSCLTPRANTDRLPMRIVFDPDFEHGCWPGPLRGHEASAGEDWVGPSRFVQVLETALGLAGPRPTQRERAARLVPAIRKADGFWSASASVDPFATARRLLQWRDTL